MVATLGRATDRPYDGAHDHRPRYAARAALRRGRARRAAGRAARLLRRRRPGRGHRREGARPLRLAGLRPQADRPQQARRGRPRVARRDLRRGARRGADRRDGGVLRARRLARGAPAGRGARAQDHRRHLPAGDQGPPRGEAVRRRRLRHPADRPRRPRGGRGHRGRGARAHPARREPGRRPQHRGPRPGQGRLALPDHAVGRRDPGDGGRDPRAVPAAARPAQRRHLLRHPEPPARGQGDRPRLPTCVIVVGSANSLQLGPAGRGRARGRRRGVVPRRRRLRDRRGLARRRPHRLGDLGRERARSRWSTRCSPT